MGNIYTNTFRALTELSKKKKKMKNIRIVKEDNEKQFIIYNKNPVSIRKYSEPILYRTREELKKKKKMLRNRVDWITCIKQNPEAMMNLVVTWFPMKVTIHNYNMNLDFRARKSILMHKGVFWGYWCCHLISGERYYLWMVYKKNEGKEVFIGSKNRIDNAIMGFEECTIA